MSNKQALCRIGKLAEKAGVPRSTINYYCRIGLIKPDGRTEGGYRLFDPESTAEKIKRFKEAVETRVTLKDLAEIRS